MRSQNAPLADGKGLFYVHGIARAARSLRSVVLYPSDQSNVLVDLAKAVRYYGITNNATVLDMLFHWAGFNMIIGEFKVHLDLEQANEARAYRHGLFRI